MYTSILIYENTFKIINTLRLRQNGQQCADNISEFISINENSCIFIQIALQHYPRCSKWQSESIGQILIMIPLKLNHDTQQANFVITVPTVALAPDGTN